MSKADYRKIFCEICMSKSRCGYYRYNDGEYCPMVRFYDMGYHQAEKDLELTWEDIRELYIIFAEVDTEIELCKTDITAETLGYYQEVLKRFREMKEVKGKG